jgi:hypothetical protein
MKHPLVCVSLGLALLQISSSAQVGAQQVAYDYTAMYEALNPSIVKVYADSGHGSGFLVDVRGYFATNHHVVTNARYVAVEYADGRKVAADIVYLDARNDLAILKVHPSTASNLTPLTLLPAERDAEVRAGIPAVAFGSPLSQTFLMTQGIVSKVEAGVLLGDFLIQSGNSGGPLVNLRGEVIGINTFAERGISGAVRVNRLREALLHSSVTSYAGPEPDPTELPTPARARYPTELLKDKVLSDTADVTTYTLDGGRFTLTAITPVLLGKLQVQADMQQAANRYQRRGKKIKDPKFNPVDEPFYEWHRNATSLLDAVVTFEVKPDFGETAGSMWVSALTAFSAGLSGTPVAATRRTIEYKAEFQELRVYKDGRLVTPITPGRQITEQSLSGAFMNFVDEAYSGWYLYDPEVFLSGRQFRIDVFDAREPGRVHKSITLSESHKLIQQLRKDFDGALPR